MPLTLMLPVTERSRKRSVALSGDYNRRWGTKTGTRDNKSSTAASRTDGTLQRFAQVHVWQDAQRQSFHTGQSLSQSVVK
jgi:hypothetical protein